MSAGMQPSNVGLGAGVRPTAPMAGLSAQTVTTKTPQSWFSGPNTIDPGVPQLGYAPIIQNPQVSTIDSGTTYSANDVAQLQTEFDRHEELRLAQQQQFAELAKGSGQSATAPSASRVGGGGGGQMTPLNPAAIPKRNDDILTAPFLGRWRNR